MSDPISKTPDRERFWQAVLERDRGFDGQFVLAVRSTGIYCRPSCPSRKPKRVNVEFYQTPDEAESAGYRACLRCRPRQPELPPQDEEAQQAMVRQVCRAIEAAEGRAPSLGELSRLVFVSPFHLQRTFKRWMGVSPHQYAEVYRQTRLRSELHQQPSVTEAVYASGYGSASSLYERAGDTLGMTPGEYRKGGLMHEIVFTTVKCSLGYLLVAGTERGICAVMLGDSPEGLIADLGEQYPAAQIRQDQAGLQSWTENILEYLDGQQKTLDLPLDMQRMQGTAFQWKVWRALQDIPYGARLTYSQVAAAIDSPKAVRAVASACASNRAALVIPCHRVIRSDGSLGGYRWGLERKKALLSKEKR